VAGDDGPTFPKRDIKGRKGANGGTTTWHTKKRVVRTRGLTNTSVRRRADATMRQARPPGKDSL